MECGILKVEQALPVEETMTDQPTFADLDYQVKKRKTRREEFLEKLDELVPWPRLEERIRPQYFRGQRGRRPYPCR